MTIKTNWLSCILTGVFLIITGCAPSMMVPVTRPAEINLRGNNRIAIGEIRGEGGPFINDLMTTKLFETGKFEIVDRANLDRVMKEHNLNMSGAVDGKTAAQLGNLVGAAVLVFGTISNYQYEVRKASKPWTNDKGVSHTTNYKIGISRVTMSIQVVGLKTGAIIAAKTISKQAEKENSEIDAWPADPDANAVMGEVVHSTVDAFIKMIAPYTEYVKVTFAKTDSAIPELERGVNFAKVGQWTDAIEQFKVAVEKNSSHQGALWDLGLAYEYNNMFDKAEDAFRKADKVQSCERCIVEIANVKKMAMERRKLEEQGSIKGGD